MHLPSTSRSLTLTVSPRHPGGRCKEVAAENYFAGGTTSVSVVDLPAEILSSIELSLQVRVELEVLV